MDEIKKAVAIAFLAILMINLVLFASRKIHALQFWLVIIIAAIIAFGLPRLKKHTD